MVHLMNKRSSSSKRGSSCWSAPMPCTVLCTVYCSVYCIVYCIVSRSVLYTFVFCNAVSTSFRRPVLCARRRFLHRHPFLFLWHTTTASTAETKHTYEGTSIGLDMRAVLALSCRSAGERRYSVRTVRTVLSAVLNTALDSICVSTVAQPVHRFLDSSPLPSYLLGAALPRPPDK